MSDPASTPPAGTATPTASRAVACSRLVEDVRRYNAWRRGDESLEMPEPKRIGESLDAICDRVEELEREREGIFRELELTEMQSAMRRGHIMALIEVARRNLPKLHPTVERIATLYSANAKIQP